MAKDAQKPLTVYYSTPIWTTFVHKDLEIMEKEFRVIRFFFNPKPKWATPWQFVRHFFHIAWHLRSIDVFVCQFATYSAFLPVLATRLLGKPSLIIAAGTESAALDSIKYGDFRHPVVKHFTRFALEHATHIAPVHKSLTGFDYTYHPEKKRRQGMDAFIRGFRTPFTEVHYGFDADKFVDRGLDRIPDSFMTIAVGFEQMVVYERKGLDLLCAVAGRHPDWKFTVVGARAPATWPHPANMELILSTTQDELIRLFNRHEFYCQLSRFEGFPNALAEAMLCGCIPVASNVTAMPDMIGDTGFILQRHDADGLDRLLQECVGRSDKHDLSQRARQRVVNNYLSGRRDRALRTLVRQLINLNT